MRYVPLAKLRGCRVSAEGFDDVCVQEEYTDEGETERVSWSVVQVGPPKYFHPITIRKVFGSYTKYVSFSRSQTKDKCRRATHLET